MTHPRPVKEKKKTSRDFGHQHRALSPPYTSCSTLHTAMSVPPATNTDPSIPLLRVLLQSIYTPIFTTFPLLQSLITQLNTNVSTLPSSLLKDDIAWAKESLDGDIDKLRKVQHHIKFLNAEETYTTQDDLLKVFEEVCDFTQLILLDDFVTTLKGVSETLKAEDEHKACMIHGQELKHIVADVQKFAISLKLACKPLRDVRSLLTQKEVKQLEVSIQSRLDDLEKRFETLMLLS